MKAFFAPWERKLGVLTLMMACTLTLSWLRSDVIRDAIRLEPSFYWPQLPWYGEIVSLEGSLGWHRFKMESGTSEVGADSPVSFSSHKVKDYYTCTPKIEDTLVWQWKSGGFGYGTGKTHLRGMSAEVWIVPYWLLVSPLTLLSVLQLLSKRRQSTGCRFDRCRPDVLYPRPPSQHVSQITWQQLHCGLARISTNCPPHTGQAGLDGH